MKDNERGLFLGDSDNNTIQHNDFINNTKQASTVDSQSSWDNGAQGNYWSDYRGTDTDGDGIGNTPYVIDADNNDNYPLMTQKLD
jgi:nitrous oxidase accessory protein NosD